MDPYGIACVGVALLLVVFLLRGHTRREHLSAQSSPWDATRVLIEGDLSKRVEYDLSTFRTSVTLQQRFFEKEKATLEMYEKALNVPLGQPLDSEMKNTAKPFDERIRILTDEMIAEGKKHTTSDLAYAYRIALAIGILKTCARTYMIGAADAGGTSPKKGSGDSTSILSSIGTLLG
jgi:hypothetical protein